MTLRIAVLLAALLGLSTWFGISQYGKTQVAVSHNETLTKTIREADKARKDDLKVDARTATENRVRLAPVRAATESARKFHAANPAPVRSPDPDGPERIRVLNDAIDAANRAIESASGVPRRVPAPSAVHG